MIPFVGEYVRKSGSAGLPPARYATRVGFEIPVRTWCHVKTSSVKRHRAERRFVYVPQFVSIRLHLLTPKLTGVCVRGASGLRPSRQFMAVSDLSSCVSTGAV